MNRAALIAGIVDDFASFKRVLLASHAQKGAGRLPTFAQIGILYLINAEGSQGIKNLAEQLFMTSSAATQLVDALVADGSLTRTADADDRRCVELALTAAGKRKLMQAKKSRVASFTKLLAPLSTQELVEWKRLQQKIIEHAS